MIWKGDEKSKAKDTIMSCRKKCETDFYNEQELNMIDDIVSKLAQKESVQAGINSNYDDISVILYGQAESIVLKRRALRNSQISQDY